MREGLSSAQQQVEQFAAKSEVSTNRASGGFSKLGGSIRQTIRPLTSLVGGITAAIGVFGAFVALGSRLGRAFTGVGPDGLTDKERDRFELEQLAQSNLQAASKNKLPSGAPNAKQLDALDRNARRAKALRDKIEKLQRLTPIAESESRRRGLTTLDPEVLRLGDKAGYSRIANYLADLPVIGGFFAGASEYGPSKLQRARLAERRGISRGRLQIEELQDELASINQTSRQLSASQLRLARSRAARASTPPILFGDSEAIRLLRTIEMHSRRRGADE